MNSIGKLDLILHCKSYVLTSLFLLGRMLNVGGCTFYSFHVRKFTFTGLPTFLTPVCPLTFYGFFNTLSAAKKRANKHS